MDFSEYAIKYSKEARESKKKLPLELLPVVEQIEDELTEDPSKASDRVVPAGRDGKTFIYLHPSPAIQITYEIDSENKIIYFFHFAAPSLEVKKSIFISYSHSDSEWLNKLRGFLTVLEQQGAIKFWDDDQLEAGERWEEQIKEALDSAVAGVLLVSQDFLASKFIKEKELPKLLDAAEEQGKKIFWIHLSPSTVFDTHEEITRYQSLLKNPLVSLEELDEAAQKKALVQISKALREAVMH